MNAAKTATKTQSRAANQDHGRTIVESPEHGQRRQSSSASAVREALLAKPGSTTTAIATAAKVGKSAAAKALAALEKAGQATRTTGSQGNPATWHPRTADESAQVGVGSVTPDATAGPATIEGTDSDATQVSAADPNMDGLAADIPATDRPGGPEPEGEAPSPDPEELAGLRRELGELTETGQAAADALAAGDLTATLERIEHLHALSKQARRTAGAITKDRHTASGRRVSAPGKLREKVITHLRENRAKEFTPYELGRAIGGHSPGAVTNALDKLTADGQARQTCEKPRRYGAA